MMKDGWRIVVKEGKALQVSHLVREEWLNP
jgi:hypothetical protein